MDMNSISTATSTHPALRKIAVLGGGISALTTVAAITDEPGWQEKYDITVYQMGWRLGGKGASGRNLEIADRIEEHGLHIWFGFYENAFRLMRRFYEEWGRDSSQPMATWQDAFKPHSLIILKEMVEGEWKHWTIEMPLRNGLPGDGGPESTPSDWIRNLLQMSRWMIETFFANGLLSDYNGTRESLIKSLGRASASSLLMFLNLADKTFNETANMLGRVLPFGNGETIRSVRESRKIFRKAFQGRIEKSDEMRRLWIILDLTLTVLYGILKDKLLERGFESVDHYDFAEWLTRHGASELTVRSAPVRVLYDIAFAYEDGDINKPNFAAGTALKGYLQIFGYKGAVMWKMQAGMGDVVFAPIYEVLKRRGVKFKFFHKIQHLSLSEDKNTIAGIRVTRQATVIKGEYNPLMDVKGLPSWPDRPFHDQLLEGEELKARGINLESSWSPWEPVELLTLEKGRDFDEVVLGISIAALPHICGEIIESRIAWKRMVENVKTVQTLASQLWFSPSAREMGYRAPMRYDENPIQGTYVEPIATWADLTHLVSAENWPDSHRPGHIGYFCGPLNEPTPIRPFFDHEFPAREKVRVRQMFREFLERDAAQLWPNAVDTRSGGFDWNLLADLKDRAGEARMDGQYFRANVEPTDRYVLSVKGSTRYRLRPDESGVENLFLTGDWTDNGFNSGCIEASVMSGLLCARAVTGQKIFIAGETKPVKAPECWREKYHTLRDCPNCGIESAVIEWVDPSLPAGSAADTTCRFCGRTERGGVLVNPGLIFTNPNIALQQLSVWSKKEGTENTEIFSRANFRGLTRHEVAQRVLLKRRTQTSFNALNWLIEPANSNLGRKQDAEPTCVSAEIHAPTAVRALATVAMVDGLVNSKEAQFIQRFLDENEYPPLQPEDLRPWLPQDLGCSIEEEQFLETMIELAWSDQKMSEKEWALIRQYAMAWHFPLDKLEQINASLERANAPLMHRLWFNLRKVVGSTALAVDRL